MPRARPLKNKPLVEALFETRWALEAGPGPEMQRDPHYKFLLGKLFENVKANFPHHEELPAASIPEELTAHVIHHRFRAEALGWPLIQVGPGVFTVNDTSNYDWRSFERLINTAFPTLIASHPKPDSLRFETLMLRFVNAIPLDAEKTNVLDFLAAKMRTTVSLPESIFSDANLFRSPVEFGTQLVFPCKQPSGVLNVKFNTGRRGDSPALLFELWFASRGRQLPTLPGGFSHWASQAHAIVENTFFHLIEGDLEKEFSGDA